MADFHVYLLLNWYPHFLDERYASAPASGHYTIERTHGHGTTAAKQRANVAAFEWLDERGLSDTAVTQQQQSNTLERLPRTAELKTVHVSAITHNRLHKCVVTDYIVIIWSHSSSALVTMDIIINLFHPCTFLWPSTHIFIDYVKCLCSVLAVSHSATLIFSFLIIIIIIIIA